MSDKHFVVFDTMLQRCYGLFPSVSEANKWMEHQEYGWFSIFDFEWLPTLNPSTLPCPQPDALELPASETK